MDRLNKFFLGFIPGFLSPLIFFCLLIVLAKFMAGHPLFEKMVNIVFSVTLLFAFYLEYLFVKIIRKSSQGLNWFVYGLLAFIIFGVLLLFAFIFSYV